MILPLGRNFQFGNGMFTVSSNFLHTLDMRFRYPIITAREQPVERAKAPHHPFGNRFFIGNLFSDCFGSQTSQICSALWDGIPRRLPDSPKTRGASHPFDTTRFRQEPEARIFCVLRKIITEAIERGACLLFVCIEITNSCSGKRLTENRKWFILFWLQKSRKTSEIGS